MAGSNKNLKDGQVLFKSGDKSDGMYVIRSGELRVFLEKDGKEVTLATIGTGGMIGEMALFDQQPRSASVKAVKDVEVTHISTDDFNKLMKQIPKWFVGLMSALSSRLRTTNERLQKLESGGTPSGKPYQTLLRILNIVILLWNKDGQKDGKDWTLNKATTEKTLVDLFDEDPAKMKQVFDVLVATKVLSTRTDSYKNVVLAMANRAALTQLVEFMTKFIKANPKLLCLPEPAIAIIKLLETQANSSPYDSITVPIPDLIKEGKRLGLETEKWAEAAATLQTAGEEVKVVKTSTGAGIRTTKKEISGYVKNHEVLAAFYKANLAK